MFGKNRIRLFLVLFSALWFFLTPPVADAADPEPSLATVDSDEIESVIQTLEDPAARETLIRNLKILARAQQPKESDSQIKSATGQILRQISRRLDRISDSFVVFIGNIHQIPDAFTWFKNELAGSASRQMWTEVLFALALTLGLGYLAFYLFRLGLFRLRRSAAGKAAEQYLVRMLRLLGIFVLDCLPILAFAMAAYLTLGLLGPGEKTRLVALAWINAFIIAHLVLAVGHFLFAPSAPGLRALNLYDETANYLLIWTRRLSYIATYGYFTLQATLLLGLPELSYEILLRAFGLVVAILVIIVILQNREGVTLSLQQWFETDVPEIGRRLISRNILSRISQGWHLLAIFYVLLLYGVWALQVEGGFVFLLRATLVSLLLFLLIRLALRFLAAAFNRSFRISKELAINFPGLEKRTNRYLNTLHRALDVAIYLVGVMTILQAWGINTFGWLTSEPGRVISGTFASVTGVLLVTFLIWEISNSFIEHKLTQKDEQGLNLETSARTRTLLAVARKALAIVLTVVSSLMVLAQVGVNIAPLLAGAGVLGLAVGFGSQKLVQDVITGVFILLEDQIAVGDVINVGDKGGLVEAVSIRTVRLRDLSGTVHTIPFSAIDIVSNLTKEFSFYVMDIGVAYREDIDAVMQVLREIGDELQQDEEQGPRILAPLEVLGVDTFADSAVVIKARIKTTPINQWSVGREFNRRMKKRFDELGIEIPFPHTTVYFGENKDGSAPAARLRVESAKPAANPGQS